MNQKQIATTEWISDGGKCKITIELEGDGVTLSDVYEQWKGAMGGIGYDMSRFDEE